MGKRLTQQRRGRGYSFKVPKHNSKGEAKHMSLNTQTPYEVKDIITSKRHSSPLIQLKNENEELISIAPEGVSVGDKLNSTEVKTGNVLSLKDIPEGTFVYNIEKNEGDGGKFVRSSGNYAKVTQKINNKVGVMLPSKKVKHFNEKCRAAVGVVAGGGRKEKPITKAGNKFKLMRKKHKQFPKVCGISMNALDHPMGGHSSHNKGRPTQVSRNTPPGRKVGKIAPKRTGKKR